MSPRDHTHPIHKSSRAPANRTIGHTGQMKKKLSLTASRNSSNTSVASLLCSPCKSNKHSVLSSGLNSPPASFALAIPSTTPNRSEEHTSELQSLRHLV